MLSLAKTINKQELRIKLRVGSVKRKCESVQIACKCDLNSHSCCGLQESNGLGNRCSPVARVTADLLLRRPSLVNQIQNMRCSFD